MAKGKILNIAETYLCSAKSSHDLPPIKASLTSPSILSLWIC